MARSGGDKRSDEAEGEAHGEAEARASAPGDVSSAARRVRPAQAVVALRTGASVLVDHTARDRDLARAMRSATAITVAWVGCHAAGHPALAVMCALAAQSVAMVDVRGGFRVRIGLLAALGAVMALAAFVGVRVGADLVGSLVAVGAVALIAGGWRHASADYGPQFAVLSGLLFFIGLSEPGDTHRAGAASIAAGLGASVGIVVQIAGWLVRPEHPLRHAVAEVWEAAATAIDAAAATLVPSAAAAADARALAAEDLEVRAAVDRTLRLLAAARSRREVLVARLGPATELAARLTARAQAIAAAVEEQREQAVFAELAPALQPLLGGLAAAARSVASTLIARSPDRLVALEAEVRRAEGLLTTWNARLDELAASSRVDGLRRLGARVGDTMSELRDAVRADVDRDAVAHPPAVEWDAPPRLAPWIDPPHRVDPLLVRHALRVALVMMAAVAAYESFAIPRGYWVPFTILVVLHPDYGSTRSKALARAAGTLGGVVVGSALLFVPLPHIAMLPLAAAAAFTFAYFVRRRYAVAMLFVTIMLVLVTESAVPVSLEFTGLRLFATLAGGVAALAAAAWLWPGRESDRFAAALAAALRADRAYLDAVGACIARGEPFAGAAVRAKREAERALAGVAASITRMLGAAGRAKESVVRAGALGVHAQRITRDITFIGQLLPAAETIDRRQIERDVRTLGGALDELAAAIETRRAVSATDTPVPTSVRIPARAAQQAGDIEHHLAKLGIELGAMEQVGWHGADAP